MIKTSSIWLEDKRKIPPVFYHCTQAIRVVKMEYKRARYADFLQWWLTMKAGEKKETAIAAVIDLTLGLEQIVIDLT